LFDHAGHVRAFATVTHDLTERKRVEETLRQERDFAETLIETAHAIVLVLDMQGRILRFNSFMEELCGYRLAEVKGQDWCETFLPQHDRRHVAQEFCLGTDGANAGGVIRPIVTKNSGERQIIWWSNTLRDARGKGTGILSIGHDITELRETQQRAVQAERLAAIGEMAAGLAHESRNALQRSQSCLEMLMLEVQDRPAALDLVQRIQKAQDHLHRLFEEVRDYAAPLQLRRKSCRLDTIIDDAWTSLELARGERSCALRHIRNSPDLLGDVDPQPLEQVFRNILENALDATDSRTQIDVVWSDAQLRHRPALAICIRDNGPGLSPETAYRLFEPFYTTKTKGTGLGMAIVKRIIEAHGGTVAAGNVSPHGTEITIVLPRRSA
jgi:PAS domain S-box-containing protein